MWNWLVEFGEWAGHHHDSIEALSAAFGLLFSIILTVSTAFLWNETRKQAQFTRDSVKLARDEFNATHRPKITVNMFRPNISVDKASEISVFFHVTNEGVAPATLIEVGTAVFRFNKPWTHGARELCFDKVSSSSVLESGQNERVYTSPKFPRSVVMDGEADNDGYFWWCIGYILYKDSAEIKRKTGFCRKWNGLTQTWDIYPNEDLNYSY